VSDIVLVHGLWNRGWMMAMLARRLRARGHKVRVFSYPTRADNLDGHADELHSFLLKNETEELHLVGHSMGGLVILNMLSRYDGLPPGRVVFGTRAFGLGQIAGKQDEPNDGSICISETELEGLHDTVELAVSHSGMLVSPEVVEQLEQFLLFGRFDKDV